MSFSFLVFVASPLLPSVPACETIEASGNVTTASPTAKRIRFTRRQTTPTPIRVDKNSESVPIEGSSNIIAALNVSTDSRQSSSDVVDSIESSVVTGSPNISVDIVTKKSLHVRNCGERIGDDVPFVATLIHTNPFDERTAKRKRSLSKGVLISENFVLATVSSIYHSESFWTVSSVRLGDFVTWNKYANRDKSHTVEIEIEEIFLHEKKDLALIKLKESVEFTDVIRPACLPSSDYYNFKELQSHLCKRSHNRAPADVTLEFAVLLEHINYGYRYGFAPPFAGSIVDVRLQTVFRPKADDHLAAGVLRVGRER